MVAQRIRILSLPRAQYWNMILAEGLVAHGYTPVWLDGPLDGTQDPRWRWGVSVKSHEFMSIEAPCIISLPPFRPDREPFVTYARILIEEGQASCWYMGSDNARFPTIARHLPKFSREPHRDTVKVPFAVADWLITPPKPGRGVTCLMHWRDREKWPRTRTMRRLRNHARVTHVGPVKEPPAGRRFRPQYLEMLRQSAATIVLPGKGWDTIRFWEALAVGTCVICPKETLLQLGLTDFLDRVLTFETNKDLYQLLDNYSDAEFNQLGLEQHQYAVAYHNAKERVAPIVEVLD